MYTFYWNTNVIQFAQQPCTKLCQNNLSIHLHPWSISCRLFFFCSIYLSLIYLSSIMIRFFVKFTFSLSCFNSAHTHFGIFPVKFGPCLSQVLHFNFFPNHLFTLLKNN